MSASIEQPAAAPARAPGHVWRAAGLVWLAVSLAALVVGAAPELIFPPHVVQSAPALDAWPAVLAVQAGFTLLFLPLLLSRPAGTARPPWRFGAEFMVGVATSLPLYALAAWLSDASVQDVARGGLYLAAVGAGAWGLSLWAGGRSWMAAAAILVAACAVLGAPAAYYLLRDVADAGPERLAWLWSVSPPTCAFSVAAEGGGLWPAPLWAWVLWPAVGVIAALARLAVRRGALDNS